jgi:hypothetical protein
MNRKVSRILRETYPGLLGFFLLMTWGISTWGLPSSPKVVPFDTIPKFDFQQLFQGRKSPYCAFPPAMGKQHRECVDERLLEKWRHSREAGEIAWIAKRVSGFERRMNGKGL